ncbi:flagellar hook-basal body complex protein FliE [Paraburkholderia xenovorans]|uniref:flagellar hook-basal body complex protein FliE n=1 Tax=Paraburkholderia xenovorans TaxID=36873 RepID=UPI000589C912|nr:flagellar hook-basal body complex protein FliE [Paraburkholderia xenovorans]
MNELNPIASALHQIQAIATEAPADTKPDLTAIISGAAGSANFGDLLRRSLTKISSEQALSTRETQKFELGAQSVALIEVMIDGANAGILFQESLQIRNSLISAYSTIMRLDL